MTSGRCHIPPQLNYVRCTHSYSDNAAQKNDFAPGWYPVSLTDGYNASTPTSSVSRLERAFLFSPPTNSEYSFTGRVANYPPGGYVADLTEYPDLASNLILDLETNNWIDQYTRAVLIEFNVLNPNSKLFNQVIVAFEYLNDGSTLWKVSVKVVQLYRYAGSAGVVALLSEIGCAIFVLAVTIFEIVRLCRMRLTRHISSFFF